MSEYGKARYAANPVATRRRAKAWAEENRERRRSISRGYYARNKDKAAAAVKRWREANRERSRATNLRAEQARRANKLGVERTEEWTTKGILDRDAWTCRAPRCLCPDGRAIRPDAPVRWRGTADHVVPLSRGGSDSPDNLRASHQACNSAKNNALDDEPTRPRGRRT